MNTSKIQLTLMLALLGMTQAVAQEYSDPILLVREGVKWVNEKVIVNHGDTTRYYYNYEICGDESLDFDLLGFPYKACYYYTDNELDVERDSLIAGLQRLSPGRYSCYRNNPYYKNLSEGKALFRLSVLFSENTEEPNLYRFQHTLEYYLMCQESTPLTDEQVLTSENFTEVDPVMIEGATCRRWCYVGDDGEPLAYVVEGIGFDSRDMGDLLTPFTRQPDHDADYQEWCGLSHVIKDGKIIYKGMRYRPDVPGDVDGDGEVTIGDANSVIDIVVMGGNTGHTRIPKADVNGDGEVTVADVNAIIDMILRHN